MGEHTTHQVRQTSLEAYADVKANPEVSEIKQSIIDAIKILGGATDYEITKHLGRSDPNFVRPRRYDLMKDELIYPAGKRPCKITGRKAIVWRAK